MNNSFLNNLLEEEKPQEDKKEILRAKSTRLAEIVEALQKISESEYWKVLKQHVFDVDLRRAKSRIAIEKDTAEIFRSQGELRWDKRLNLEKLLIEKRNELQEVRKNI